MTGLARAEENVMIC